MIDDEILTLIAPPDPEWRVRAACKGMDPELFFPGRGNNLELKAAKAVCADCPVRTECLEFALGMGEMYGVWGGLSERARKQLRADRARARRAARQATVPRPPHGTDSGYAAHIRRGETTCEACRDAHALAKRMRAEASQRCEITVAAR